MEREWTPATEAELDREIEASRATSEIAGEGFRAVAARYNRRTRRLEVEMRGGWMLAIPVVAMQGLAGATATQLAQVEIEGDGYALHWEELDADFTVPGIVAGRIGTKAWMRELGRRAGSVRSEAKARAARANGLKGGRPRKKPTPSGDR
ncbi:DUF2442 domain-containing protein [soil metagenome]